ncbi:hypothetical protein FB555_000099 [Alpinimonas psychrophila]|uniref:Uncharacterized protein n=1 Tax=Alpinimonas psychrophila TaxID=748908 RepID=A0A7W3JRR8_9MICO|nr:hypothetical protein [Alpinimonas psychrophila]
MELRISRTAPFQKAVRESNPLHSGYPKRPLT